MLVHKHTVYRRMRRNCQFLRVRSKHFRSERPFPSVVSHSQLRYSCCRLSCIHRPISIKLHSAWRTAYDGGKTSKVVATSFSQVILSLPKISAPTSHFLRASASGAVRRTMVSGPMVVWWWYGWVVQFGLDRLRQYDPFSTISRRRCEMAHQ